MAAVWMPDAIVARTQLAAGIKLQQRLCLLLVKRPQCLKDLFRCDVDETCVVVDLLQHRHQ
eukprot:12188192-Prorocentrum_lima.AAC.1